MTWRRVVSLSSSSSLISSFKSKSTLRNQEAALCGMDVFESFFTSASSRVKELKSLKEKNPFITFVLGGPGSGKGTQCMKIAEAFGFTHLSAGELLRQELMANTEDGVVIMKSIKEGRIVPSEVTIKLLVRQMEADSSFRFLIDGFPRSQQNRIAFENIVGLEPNMVLFFCCPEEEMVKRVLNRNQGRIDDNLDIVKRRLKVFEALCVPVINYYSKKGKLRTINAIGTVDEIFERVRPVLEALEVSNPC